MRRKEKEITDRNRISAILQNAAVCRLGLSANNMPYIVPLSFACEDNYLFIHSAPDGRKIDILRENGNVCFEVESETALKRSENACSTSLKYESVIGYGRASFVEDADEKKRALKLIVRKYTGNDNAPIPEDAAARTLIIRIDITEITGKSSG